MKGATALSNLGFYPARNLLRKATEKPQIVPPRHRRGTFTISSSCPQWSGLPKTVSTYMPEWAPAASHMEVVKLMQGS